MKVLLIGLPNVGKSTIFNKLSGKKHALVSPQAGLTRNFKSKIIDDIYELIDAPGISYIDDISTICSQKVLNKAKEVDILLYIIDNDLSLFNEIRKLNKTTIIVSKTEIDEYIEYPKVTLEDEGYYRIHELLLQYTNDKITNNTKDKIKIAFIGMMNSGKSSIINKIIGEDKLLVYDKRGVTTDSIRVEYKDSILIDTAGIQYTDKLIFNDMYSAIEMSHIVAYIVDATETFTKHDQRICSKIINEGRGIMILVNKCDISSFRLQEYQDMPIIHVNNNYDYIYKSLIQLYDKWNINVKTHDLNKAIINLTLPRKVKIKYICQRKTRPPHFNLYGIFNDISPSIKAQIINRIRKNFNLYGIPIRLSFIKKNNPYVHDGI